MRSGDEYRIKAAELNAQAKLETAWFNRAELESLGLSYLRLAYQADRNAKTDIVYEPLAQQHRPKPQVQQQQQPQSDSSRAQRHLLDDKEKQVGLDLSRRASVVVIKI